MTEEVLTYSLVSETNPILKMKTELFDFNAPPINPVILYRNMANTMLEKNGIGLAAPQVGLPYRMFVMRTHPEVLGIFNPILVDFSEEQIILEEGCLSFSNLLIKVKRPRKIRARFTNPDGQTETRVFDGITARCFLHELDHLNGTTMLDVVSRTQVDLAMRKRNKLLTNGS